MISQAFRARFLRARPRGHVRGAASWRRIKQPREWRCRDEVGVTYDQAVCRAGTTGSCFLGDTKHTYRILDRPATGCYTS